MSPQARERAFDALATEMASGSISRGKALRLMGAALLGGTLASLGIGEAAADECKRNGKACKKNSQCCSRNCAAGEEHSFCACQPNGGTCMANDQCCSGNCANGTCAPLCPPLPACTDTCPCPSGQTCLNGACCVMLSNGTCAKPCTCDPFCTGEECAGGCGCFFRDIDQQTFCGFEIPLEGCGTDDGCARGQFCDGHACIGAC